MTITIASCSSANIYLSPATTTTTTTTATTKITTMTTTMTTTTATAAATAKTAATMMFVELLLSCFFVYTLTLA